MREIEDLIKQKFNSKIIAIARLKEGSFIILHESSEQFMLHTLNIYAHTFKPDHMYTFNLHRSLVYDSDTKSEKLKECYTTFIDSLRYADV